VRKATIRPPEPRRRLGRVTILGIALGLVLAGAGGYALYCYAFQGTPETTPASDKDKQGKVPSAADARIVKPTVVRKVPRPGPAPAGMVWIPPGRFLMGSDYEQFGDARPIHTVEIDGFWMDKTPVTNEQFAKFVKATGYVTIAERKPDWEEMKKHLPPDAQKPDPSLLVPGSVVFSPPDGPVNLDNYTGWWKYVPGAC
jgi:formylglycine-generating enzyme required for sulfatase activity